MSFYSNFYWTNLPKKQVKKIINEQIQKSRNGNYSPYDFEEEINDPSTDPDAPWIQLEYRFEGTSFVHDITRDIHLCRNFGGYDKEKFNKEEFYAYCNAGGTILYKKDLLCLKREIKEALEDHQFAEYFDINDEEVVQKLIAYSWNDCDEDLWDDDLPGDVDDLVQFGQTLHCYHSMDDLINLVENKLTVFYIGYVG